MKVQLFIPCFVDQLYPQTAFNMVKVLKKAGCEVEYNANQTCCGQPAFNAGFWEESKTVCAKFLADFDNADYIVAPSASCVGFVRNYYKKLFEDSPLVEQINNLSNRLFEFTELLTDKLMVTDFGAVLNINATYHDSCAGLRECNIKEGPRKLLSYVKGLNLIEMKDVETCCGFGGTFAVKFDSISVAMADQKLNHVLETNAELIISTDLSCLMHINGCITEKNHPLKTMHIADVLAAGW